MAPLIQVPPHDPYNQTLVSNAHPADWQNPTPDGRYNLLVIGGGSAGLVAAIAASGLGAKVALAEKHLLGRTDGEEGFTKIYVKRGSDQILGATIIARHAGEMISEITTAMIAGAGMSELARTIHPYPTQAEMIKKAADAWNRTRLTPTVAKLLRTLLNWRRG